MTSRGASWFMDWLRSILGDKKPKPKPTPVRTFRGIYVTTDKIDLLEEAIPEVYFQAPEMDGIAIRVEWAAIEPAPDAFDWSLIDSMVTNAVRYGKNISFSIVAASKSPEWVTQASGELVFGSITMPTVWSPVYTDRLINAYARARDYFASKGAADLIMVVKPCPHSTDTVTLDLPREESAELNAVAIWQAAGYTETLILDSYATVRDAVAALYPAAVLCQPVVEGAGFPRIDANGVIVKNSENFTNQKIIDASLAVYGQRWVGQDSGLGKHLAAHPMSARLAYISLHGGSVSWQTNKQGSSLEGSAAACWFNVGDPELKCTAALYATALSRGIEEVGTFIEVWPRDFDEFRDAIRAARSKLLA